MFIIEPFLNETLTALDIINVTSPEHARSLSDLIPAELIQQALTLTDTVTLANHLILVIGFIAV